MTIHYWTPNGRKEQRESEETYRLEVINHMQAMVRETAYHLARLNADGAPHDESYSRSACLYEKACESLRFFAGETYANEYITKTFKP